MLPEAVGFEIQVRRLKLSLLVSSYAMAERSRSRSRERIISLAAMSQLHRLPRQQRVLVQKLRATIDVITDLARLRFFFELLEEVSQQAMSCQFLDLNSVAFSAQANLRPVTDRLSEINQEIQDKLQEHLNKLQSTFVTLTQTPDGSPYPMSFNTNFPGLPVPWNMWPRQNSTYVLM